MVLFHGSDKVIQKPLFAYGRTDNDYGQGFYCTENFDLAAEWAATSDKGGIVNQYDLDISSLKVLDLSSNEYTLLNWLSVLLSNRVVRFNNPIEERGRDYILTNFSIDTSSFDVIKGFRADDSYFSFSRAFLSNTITYQQLQTAMHLGNLGIQIFLKSKKAFNKISFTNSSFISDVDYHFNRVKRDSDARTQYQEMLKKTDEKGLYLSDLMRKEISYEELRLL